MSLNQPLRRSGPASRRYQGAFPPRFAPRGTREASFAHGSVFRHKRPCETYHEEVGSVFVQQLFEVPEQVSFISRLCAIEMHSVLAGKVRIGEITAEAMELARRRFRADARRRRFHVVALRTRTSTPRRGCLLGMDGLDYEPLMRCNSPWP
jgi:hypothetical protein